MMRWHRDGQGGYVGEDTARDASAKIGRTSSPRRPAWSVRTFLYGAEIDRSYFSRLADAKWHAEETARDADYRGGRTL